MILHAHNGNTPGPLPVPTPESRETWTCRKLGNQSASDIPLFRTLFYTTRNLFDIFRSFCCVSVWIVLFEEVKFSPEFRRGLKKSFKLRQTGKVAFVVWATMKMVCRYRRLVLDERRVKVWRTAFVKFWTQVMDGSPVSLRGMPLCLEDLKSLDSCRIVS